MRRRRRRRRRKCTAVINLPFFLCAARQNGLDHRQRSGIRSLINHPIKLLIDSFLFSLSLSLPLLVGFAEEVFA